MAAARVAMSSARFGPVLVRWVVLIGMVTVISSTLRRVVAAVYVPIGGSDGSGIGLISRNRCSMLVSSFTAHLLSQPGRELSIDYPTLQPVG